MTTQVNRRVDWVISSLLVLFHIIALVALTMTTWTAVITFLVLYAVSVLGITVGFHRYFTHKSFKATKPLEWLLAIMGTIALQGSLFKWVAHHRMHHAGSDTEKDPHDASRGFWFSHLVWMLTTADVFDKREHQKRYVRDIMADPFLMFISQAWFVFGCQIVLGLGLWATLGLEAMLWGIFVRLIAVYHVTWAVNSVCHMWGYQNFKVKDLSKNNWLIGLLAFGEGWHNNHHAVEYSAKHGLKWWEFDISYLFIRLMQGLGQARDLRIASLPEEKPNPVRTSTSTIPIRSSLGIPLENEGFQGSKSSMG